MKNSVFLIAIAVLFGACSMFELDMEKHRTITVISPEDGLVTTSQDILFMWEEIDVALAYHLEVVSPSFDSIEAIYFDTLIERGTTRFYGHLDAGYAYEWRIRGENNTSATPYVIQSIQVDSTDDLCQNSVQLLSPTTSSYTNDSSITFNWESMIGADYYELSIAAPGVDYVVVAQNITTTSQSINLNDNSLSDEGTYRWKVKAYNDKSFTCNDQVYTYTLDTTAPAVGQLVSPIQNTILDTTLTDFEWTAAAEIASTELYVYGGDSTSLVNGFPRTITGATFQYNLPSTDSVFYWQISQSDSAGNVSELNTIQKFFVN